MKKYYSKELITALLITVLAYLLFSLAIVDLDGNIENKIFIFGYWLFFVLVNIAFYQKYQKKINRP